MGEEGQGRQKHLFITHGKRKVLYMMHRKCISTEVEGPLF
jgi:hypothetical protein